ncbi:preprotein translocase subunit YajC [Ferriphaselus amnicola]
MLISNAYAEGAAPAAGGGIMDFLPLIALLAVFYFLVLRPQQKRAKDQKAMLEALSKGDEVLTTGGIMGRVTKIGETYTSIEIAENVVIQVQKETIQSVLPKGTIRSAN